MSASQRPAGAYTVRMPWAGHNARVLAEREEARNRRPPDATGALAAPPKKPQKRERSSAVFHDRPGRGTIMLQVLEYLEHLASKREILPPDLAIASEMGLEHCQVRSAMITLRSFGHIDINNRMGRADVRVLWLADAARELRSRHAPANMSSSRDDARAIPECLGMESES